MSSSLPAELPPRSAQRQVADLLASHGIPNASHEARLLLHGVGFSATDLAFGRRPALGEDGARSLADALGRRLAGEPVARILGAWEFWGLPFALSPGTLVPRPDTETVVEAALALVGERSRPLRLLDLGTGTGCLLVALLSELPRAFGIGSDRSAGALATARRNADTNGVGERAAFVLGDWCAPLRGPFDLIASNPPYIASAVIPGLEREVREHDPLAALDGGPDGLSAYRAIIGGIAARPALLAADGALVLEIGYDQAEAVRQLGAEAGFAIATVGRDLSGNDRVVTLRPPLPANAASTKVFDD